LVLGFVFAQVGPHRTNLFRELFRITN
jgi:hypothetical protein